jgi:alanine racemase
MPRATRALIHLDNLRENIALVKKRCLPAQTGGVSVCMPVKADGYGHGAVPVAKAALEAGAKYLAVATVREGEELREAGIASSILLLSIPLPEEIPNLIEARLEPLAGDAAYIDALADAAHEAHRNGAVHLNVDTGMGRIGCPPEEAGALAARIADRGLFLAGTATHLAVSDSVLPDDIAYTKAQIERFRAALDGIRALGMDPGIVHAANTGGVVFHPESWFDMVRPGILLYGYAPEDADGKPALPVKPLMEVESRIVFSKMVKKGESVSYGRTWTAQEDTVVGTIPIGYADGLPRLASNRWRVWVEGAGLCPLVGRICMDQCMVDLGKNWCQAPFPKVAVFGGEAPGAAALGAAIGTISYEVCCSLNKRVPRVYLG